MSKITEKMERALIKIHDKLPENLSHEARIAMLNTLLGDGFKGVFTYTYDTRSEALQEVKRFGELYDIDFIENKEERYFIFDTTYTDSLYHGLSAKLNYLE